MKSVSKRLSACSSERTKLSKKYFANRARHVFVSEPSLTDRSLVYVNCSDMIKGATDRNKLLLRIILGIVENDIQFVQ